MTQEENFGGLDNFKVGNVAEFYNDVHIYGKLYADLEGTASGGTGSGGNGTFINLDVEKNITIGGDLRVENLIDTDYLTVRHRLHVGVGGTVLTVISKGEIADGEYGNRVGIGTTQPDTKFQVGDKSFVVTEGGSTGIGTTQPDGIFQVGNECLTVTVNPCRVGIATTVPDGRFQVGYREKSFIVASDPVTGVSSVGIGTTQPYQRFQVGKWDDSFVVTDTGIVGIGSTNPGNIPGYNASQEGPIKLDIEGSVKIDKNIIDSADSPGANGWYLNRDSNGIRWVNASPVNLDGIYVQDESVYLPINGTSQLFSTINFRQVNSLGLGTDTVLPIPDPENPTQIARIQTQDLWGHVGSANDAPIYRMTKVGIKNDNPSTDLDISGTVHATGAVDFDTTLNTDGAVTFNSTLDVDGATTLNNTLDVDGIATFNDLTDSTSPTATASVQIDGGVGIAKRLFVGGDTKIESPTQSTTKDIGALVVDGGVGIEKDVNIGGDLHIHGTTQSPTKDLGALIVEGGVGIEKNLNVGQNTKLIGTLELESSLIDYNNLIPDPNDASNPRKDWRLTSIGVGVSWRPSGVETENIIFVTLDGDDDNEGLLEGDALRTIGKAAEKAQPGDTIKVRSGVYYEDNPIGLRTDVTVKGEDIRLVTIIPNNPNWDVFHVRRGCLIENLNFSGTSVSQDNTDCAAVAFPPTQAYITSGVSPAAVSGFLDVGPANEGPSGRYRSPYIRNCTNFMSKSIGMRINGHHVDAAFTGTNNLGQDLKSMVCDSFTQYNEAGIGVSISNNGYAQLVSIFTIGNQIGIGCTSGGQCDLTNSNSSFGTFGLVSDGTSVVEFDGNLNADINGESDIVVLNQVRDFNNPRQYRTPFDGQGAYFHLDMNDYPDSPSTASITKPLQFIRGITVVNGGNPGDYSESAPPLVTATLPEGPESIFAEFSPNVSAAGTITSVDIIASGRNFLPTQNVVLNISGGGTAQLTADMDPILYTIDESTKVSSVTGLSTVTFNEFIPYKVKATSKMEFVRLSRIITSSHSFEYIGAGTDINIANPFQGGKPIPENEVVAINGGQCPFTSTDQKGNFRIGDGLTIDQTTSTIRGRDFNRAIQAQMTPLILALR